jgi:hypothetical protein
MPCCRANISNRSILTGASTSALGEVQARLMAWISVHRVAGSALAELTDGLSPMIKPSNPILREGGGSDAVPLPDSRLKKTAHGIQQQRMCKTL